MDRPRRLGDYLVFPAFAQGGTASVHLGRLVRAGGFRRLCVVKRLQDHVVDSGAADRLLREAKLTSRVRSPYVVATLDVVHKGRDLALVMDLVQGVTLGRLVELASERNTLLPPAVVVAIISDVLHGLHAAHEATSESGAPLELLHRDVSPRNVMIGVDGLARVLDFELAKALGQHGVTSSGEVRGTVGYMAPEQLRGNRPVTRQADIYAVGVLAWEALTAKRFRPGDTATAIAALDGPVAAPSSTRKGIPPALDKVIMRALAVEPSERFPSADAMAFDLIAALPAAAHAEVAATVEKLALDDLERLRERVAECERFEVETHDRAPESTRESYVGDVIADKYRVDGVLGRGGMGVVLNAKHLKLDEPVAIKLLRASDNDDTANERILREARASLRIKSEHVVRVFDVGVHQNHPYLVMEKLEGKDLRALLEERGPLPVDEAALFILQACEVVAEAHSLGIVHRDLKPANLFVTNGSNGVPRLKVLDFGIAKASAHTSAGAPSLTETQGLLGSPAYMSPEQLRNAKHVDERSDIWSLGVVLYQLLTDRHPFSIDDADQVLLGRIVADDPVPLRTRRADVPEGLAQAVERCLEKDPARRYRSAGQLALALEPFAPGGQATVERIRRVLGPALINELPAAQPARTQPPSSLPSSAERRRSLLAVIGAGVVVVGAVAAYSVVRAQSQPTVTNSAPTGIAPEAPAPTIASVTSVAAPAPEPPSTVITPPPIAPTPTPSLSASVHRPAVGLRDKRPTGKPAPPKPPSAASPSPPVAAAPAASPTPAPAPAPAPVPVPVTSAPPPKKTQDPTSGFE